MTLEMTLKPLTTKNIGYVLKGVNAWKADKKRAAPASGNLGIEVRFDPEYVGQLAKEIAPNPPIIDVMWRGRGGPVDVFFVVEDRERGYEAAGPVIRRLLTESSLALDFHFVEPSDALPDE